MLNVPQLGRLSFWSVVAIAPAIPGVTNGNEADLGAAPLPYARGISASRNGLRQRSPYGVGVERRDGFDSLPSANPQGAGLRLSASCIGVGSTTRGRSPQALFRERYAR